MALLGIDVGTTACKVVLFDLQDRILGTARKEYKLRHPCPDWAEIEPEEMWEAVAFCISSVLGGKKEKVEGLAISSHGEGVIPLNDEGKALGPEIVSFDLRAVNETQELERNFGKHYFFEKGGQLLASTGTAAKIMWMKKHSKSLKEEPAAYVCAGDYIAMRLSGKRVIDYSLAARTMLFDIHAKKWNLELLDYIGIKETQLSVPVQAGTMIGCVNKEVAKELLLSDETIVVSGGHDQACAMLGTGAVETGEATYSLGTTETLVCSMDSFVPKLYEYGLVCYPHVIANQYITLPGNFTGGNLLQWYKNNFAEKEQEQAQEQGKDVYEILMEEMEDKPSKLMVLPHFTTTGSPWNDSGSYGMVVGLRLSTTKGQYIRALQEGVTLEILLNLEVLKKAGIEVTTLIAVGGGTKSQKLMQLKADVLGLPISTLHHCEAPCKGAAILAGYGIDRRPSLQEKKKEVLKDGNIVHSHANMHRQYIETFVKYKRMYLLQKEILK